MIEDIPESLLDLFTDLDFLAGIADNQKYCFGKRYYAGIDWYGSLLRIRDNESQDVNGIAAMTRICSNASQQLKIYKNNEKYKQSLIKKMVAARHGLSRVVKTYKSFQKHSTAGNIVNRPMMILDYAIPDSIKTSEGIIFEIPQKDNRSENIKIRNSNSDDEKSISSMGKSPDENSYHDSKLHDIEE